MNCPACKRPMGRNGLKYHRQSYRCKHCKRTGIEPPHTRSRPGPKPDYGRFQNDPNYEFGGSFPDVRLRLRLEEVLAQRPPF